MASKRKTNLIPIVQKEKAFINKNSFLRRIHIQTEARRIIQEAMRKVLKKKTAHTKRAYMSKNRLWKSKGTEC
jgi:hypothetical protein